MKLEDRLQRMREVGVSEELIASVERSAREFENRPEVRKINRSLDILAKICVAFWISGIAVNLAFAGLMVYYQFYSTALFNIVSAVTCYAAWVFIYQTTNFPYRPWLWPFKREESW